MAQGRQAHFLATGTWSTSLGEVHKTCRLILCLTGLQQEHVTVNPRCPKCGTAEESQVPLHPCVMIVCLPQPFVFTTARNGYNAHFLLSLTRTLSIRKHRIMANITVGIFIVNWSLRRKDVKILSAF